MLGEREVWCEMRSKRWQQPEYASSEDCGFYSKWTRKHGFYKYLFHSCHCFRHWVYSSHCTPSQVKNHGSVSFFDAGTDPVIVYKVNSAFSSIQFILTSALCFYPQLTDEETDWKRLYDLPKVIQPINDRTKNQPYSSPFKLFLPRQGWAIGSLPSCFPPVVVSFRAFSDPQTSGLRAHQSAYSLGPVGWAMERGQPSHASWWAFHLPLSDWVTLLGRTCLNDVVKLGCWLGSLTKSSGFILPIYGFISKNRWWQWELFSVLLVGGAQLHSFVDKHKLDIFEIEGLKLAKEWVQVWKTYGESTANLAWVLPSRLLLLFSKPRNISQEGGFFESLKHVLCDWQQRPPAIRRTQVHLSYALWLMRCWA